MRGAIIVLLLGTLRHVFANFEYGEHKPGEVLALTLIGTIDPFIPIYRLNMGHRLDVDDQLTYVTVKTETISTYKPRIIYDSSSNILTFFMRYPLNPVTYEVYGYSMPLSEYTGIIPDSTLPGAYPEGADEEENTTVQESTK